MLIQELGCPDLIIARQLLLAGFCNTIGTNAKSQQSARMFAIDAMLLKNDFEGVRLKHGFKNGSDDATLIPRRLPLDSIVARRRLKADFFNSIDAKADLMRTWRDSRL